MPQARSGGTWGHGGHSPKSFFCILEAVGAVAGEGQRAELGEHEAGRSWQLAAPSSALKSPRRCFGEGSLGGFVPPKRAGKLAAPC